MAPRRGRYKRVFSAHYPLPCLQPGDYGRLRTWASVSWTAVRGGLLAKAACDCSGVCRIGWRLGLLGACMRAAQWYRAHAPTAGIIRLAQPSLPMQFAPLAGWVNSRFGIR